MKNKDVELLLDQVESDLKIAQNLALALGPVNNANPYINKYSIIRACGAVEVSYKAIISDYLVHRSKKQVKTYINTNIRSSSSNPSYDNICRTLKSFDKDWLAKFKSLLLAKPNSTQIFDSLESLVEARNEFAHGGDPNSTVSDVLRYFTDSRFLLEILDSVVS
jgi:hypothetical protein